MPFTLYDSNAKEKKEKPGASSIVAGVVANNCDLVMQGKVLVRIPSLGTEVWARLVAIGAGNGRGFMFVPQVNDEVLVAMNQNDPNDSFVIGGLWSNQDRLPALAPTDPLTKRTIKSGLAGGLGHEIEFDDALQSVTIKTSLQQMIKMSPTGVQIISGSNVINMSPPAAPTPTVQIVSGSNIVNLSPDGVTITAGAKNLTLNGATINIVATTACNIKAPTVMIN